MVGLVQVRHVQIDHVVVLYAIAAYLPRVVLKHSLAIVEHLAFGVQRRLNGDETLELLDGGSGFDLDVNEVVVLLQILDEKGDRGRRLHVNQ